MKLILILLLFSVCYARNHFPDKTTTEFQNQCLSASNAYRTKHRAPALKVDSKIVDYAKSRCKLISQSTGLSHGHAGLKGHGENIFWGGRSDTQLYPCSAAINSCYKEVKYYDYSKPGFSMKVGHFTQLVWVATTLLGCARCGGQGAKWYETYIVCNYQRQGNVKGAFDKNVLAK